MPDESPAPLDLFAVVHTALKSYVETTLGGLFSLAADPFEVMELLAEAPGRFRCILQWQGEKPVGDHRSGIVEETLHVVVSHNRGLPMLKGSNLHVPRGETASLRGRVSLVRDFLRALAIDDERTSKRLKYEGTEPVKVESHGHTYQLDAYELAFSVLGALPKLA